MNTENKEQIREQLKKYIAHKGSQNKAAHSLTGVSSALISQIMNQNWELISDQMWRNVASQIGYSTKPDWNIIQTSDYILITKILTDAQTNSHVYAMVGGAGTGKSITLKNYCSEHTNAYLLSCNEYWNKKFFIAELLTVMGRDYSGLTIPEMMTEVVKQLKQKETPIIILDEADKLTDQVLYFFITLYNQLEDHCGIVLVATDHLAKRIKRGIKLNKKGYNEIYSRIGRKFIELNGLAYTDVVNVSLANGIDDKKEIKAVWDDCEGDLRRVKRKIHALKLKKDAN